MKVSGDLQSNGLIVGIDWLSFTVKDFNNPWDVINTLGMDASAFTTMEHGAYGYKSMLRHKCESVSILYDGNEGMGIHVDITGSAISYALNSFRDSRRCNTPFGPGYELPPDYPEKLMCLYLAHIREFSDISRIDAYIDDHTKDYFTVSDVCTHIDEKRLVSPFRKSRYHVEKDVNSGSITGETLYLGSRKSEVFLRVYDKALEQKLNASWVRWELEIKGAKADVFVDELLNNGCLGSVIIGVLGRYVRFINFDDSNRSRCSMYEKWALFVNGVDSLRLTVVKKEFSVERSENWVDTQCMPTIAGLVYSHGGDLTWIVDKLDANFERLPREKRDAFMHYREKRDAFMHYLN